MADITIIVPFYLSDIIISMNIKQKMIYFIKRFFA